MNYCELAEGAVTITLSRWELEEVAELLFAASTRADGGTDYDEGPVAELIELAFPTTSEDELADILRGDA